MDMTAKEYVSRAIPNFSPETSMATPRLSRYRDRMVIPVVQKSMPLVDEGSYFVATSGTPGTAIAYAVTASFSDTAGAYLYIYNTGSAGDVASKRLWLDRLKLITMTAPASSTSAHYAVKTDVGNRYSSGGSAITPTNPNTDLPAGDAVAKIYAGALTLAAAGANTSRVVARGAFKNAIPVVGDEYIINFGSIDGAQSQAPAVALGPNQGAAVSLWFPANATTAGQFEFELGYYYR